MLTRMMINNSNTFVCLICLATKFNKNQTKNLVSRDDEK
jgi:hypothetical protein